MNGNEHYEQIGVAMTCRGFEEYMRMFALEEADLHYGEILDVAAGASSFTAEAAKRGCASHAVDPQYGMPADELFHEGMREIETSTAKLVGLEDRMDFSFYGNMENHRALRERSLRLFGEDFTDSGGGARYSAGSLPSLPFEDGRFSLVLCSHFLFLYAEQFGYEFHFEAVRELLRVCKSGGQVRIYPLFTLRFGAYRELDRLIAELEEEGCRASFAETRLPFIPGSEQNLTDLFSKMICINCSCRI